MAATSEETKISLKLLVDTEKNKLVFAEADYSFVDILFSFMTLPMGTIVRILGKDFDQKFEALGSLRTLYDSVVNLPAKCLSSEECKLMLLNPGNPLEGLFKKLKLNIDDSGPTKYFACENRNRRCYGYFSIYKGIACCKCGQTMNVEIGPKFDGSSHNDGVFVNDMTTFIITDDLCVIPKAIGSSIRLLQDVGLTDSSDLEERTVDIGLKEIRNLLNCALSCKSPLSYLFLPKTNVIQERNFPISGKADQPFTNKVTTINMKKMSLKVTCQKSTGKFLFAEAKEDFVDLLISFLTTPLGTVIDKLNCTTSLGNIDNIYTSISNMCVRKYLKSDVLLRTHKAICYPDPIIQRGFVTGPATFVVTDDLVIIPLSSISCINFLNKLKVPFSDVEEHDISIGMDEALRILEGSLKSSSALSAGLTLPLKRPKQEI